MRCRKRWGQPKDSSLGACRKPESSKTSSRNLQRKHFSVQPTRKPLRGKNRSSPPGRDLRTDSGSKPQSRFNQGLSATTTWENAPPSIRQPPNNTSPTPTYRPPSMELQTKRHSDTAQRVLPDLTPRFQTNKDTQQRLESTTHQSMTDTSTTNSLMTKSLATQQRFHELESVIRQQNQDIRAHQAAFLAVNTRFDELLEERVITMMTFCKDTSQNVLELRKETNENILGMRQEASTQAAKFRQTFAHLTKMMTSIAGSSGTTDDDDDSTASSDQSDNMSVKSLDTTKHGTSPRKKKGKRRRQDRNLDSITKNHNPTPDQDPSARYKEKSTPDDVET